MNRRTVAAGLAIILSGAMMVACDGKSPTSPSNPGGSPVVSPPSGTPVFSQTFTGTVKAHATNYTTMHQFVAPRDGEATLTLNWINGAVDLDLSLTNGSCQDFDGWSPTTGECPLFKASMASVGTSEQITHVMKSGDSYRLWVINIGDFDQAYTLQVRID